MESKVLDTKFYPATEERGYLMIVLHGRGDSRDGFAWLPEALAFPDMAYLMPNAPDDYFGGYSWYGLPPDQGPGVVRSRKLLDALLAETQEAGFPVEKTFVLGFSQGCLMSWEWGGRLGVSLAGVVGISGYVHEVGPLKAEFTDAAKATPRLITHGTEDEVLPFEVSERQARELEAGGIRFTWAEFEKGHTILPEELVMIRRWIEGVMTG